MINLLLFIMATIGLTNILIYGSIFNGLREWIKKRVSKKVREGMECYQCMGTWVGAFCGYVMITHEIGGVFMCAFAGSFAAMLAAKIVEYLEANSMVSLGENK